jgi:hypothetical protein
MSIIHKFALKIFGYVFLLNTGFIGRAASNNNWKDNKACSVLF